MHTETSFSTKWWCGMPPGTRRLGRSRSRTACGGGDRHGRPHGQCQPPREDGCHADFDGCGSGSFPSPGRQRTRGESYRRDQSTRRSGHLGAGSTGSAGGVALHRPSGDLRAAGRTGYPDDVVHLGRSFCPRPCLEGIGAASDGVRARGDVAGGGLCHRTRDSGPRPHRRHQTGSTDRRRHRRGHQSRDQGKRRGAGS